VEQVVLQKVVDWAHPMWRENHIYIIEESEQGFPRLEVAVHLMRFLSATAHIPQNAYHHTKNAYQKCISNYYL
jgi:hypothetical protein